MISRCLATWGSDARKQGLARGSFAVEGILNNHPLPVIELTVNDARVYIQIRTERSDLQGMVSRNGRNVIMLMIIIISMSTSMMMLRLIMIVTHRIRT